MDLFFLLAAGIQSRGDRTRMGTFGDQEMVSHHGEGRAGKGPCSALGAALCSPREELLGSEVGLWGWLPGALRLWSRGEPGCPDGLQEQGAVGCHSKTPAWGRVRCCEIAPSPPGHPRRGGWGGLGPSRQSGAACTALAVPGGCSHDDAVAGRGPCTNASWSGLTSANEGSEDE